ncbi:nitrogenase component 1 [uncultured Methanomethylovorans sp.]|uniref:nitrogenase component 1 n=1 Tax=uncultured Methanomethylovorans sp. TaxID=183759 RepID=UPI002AA6B835|nr:nitrogenase component 1 [uncultured Methanomethylovorans sp.]
MLIPTCIFKGLADYVMGISCGITPLFSAFPLTELEMESIVLGRNIAEERCFYTSVSRQEQPSFRSPVRTGKHFLTKGVKNKEPLHGCALAGAVTSAVNVTDALTIVHGPRSCAHILSNFLQSSSLKEKVRHGILMPDNRENVILPTDMGEEAFIFGGMDELRQCVENAIGDGWDTIFIATTCPAGLIGDDVELAISCLKSDNPDIKILPLLVDGNLEGDFAQGLVEGYRKVADLVDVSHIS